MEDLGDILKRLATRDTSEDNPYASRPGPNDDVDVHEPCGGRGWFTADVPVGHPDFGQVVICECQNQRVEDERYARLLRYSNLGSLSRFTFQTVKPEGLSDDRGSSELFSEACRAAVEYAEAPTGWLVLGGPHGAGKTHLAAAIGNRCIERGRVVFFTHVPDLMDHLRAAFSPGSEIGYSDLFEQVKNTPLLILDGLTSQGSTPWAEEKLQQIVNHRYNSDLPTVVTIASPLTELDPYLSSRLRTPSLSRVLELSDPAPERTDSMGRIPGRLLKLMTFDSFDVRGNSPTPAQRERLEYAYKFAKAYAADPDGWLTLFGETGAGKTHLAVAIAAERLKAGHAVFFVMVADLLDHLRAAYGPESRVTYDERFDEIKDAPLLVLDDLGKQRSSSWADEKLHQIIVHRHNNRLPTVITTMIDASQPEEGPIGSRIQDPSVGELIRMDAPDYRKSKKRRPRAQGRSPARGQAGR